MPIPYSFGQMPIVVLPTLFGDSRNFVTSRFAVHILGRVCEYAIRTNIRIQTARLAVLSLQPSEGLSTAHIACLPRRFAHIVGGFALLNLNQF
jgi:hypothetical protein